MKFRTARTCAFYWFDNAAPSPLQVSLIATKPEVPKQFHSICWVATHLSPHMRAFMFHLLRRSAPTIRLTLLQVVKPVRRACARGSKFGQDASLRPVGRAQCE